MLQTASQTWCISLISIKKTVRCRSAIIRNVEWNVTPQKLDPKIQKHWSSLASSFHYMYRFMWSLQQSNDIVTSCLRFVHVKICFNTNYLSHLALLYKMIVSMATCALMCIKVLFLKANFLVYTTQKSQPSQTFMFQCIILFPIKVQLYPIIFWI